MSRYIMGLLFVVIWLAVSGSYTLANLLLGALVAALSLGLIRHQLKTTDTYWGRVPAILSLGALFIKELALSAWSVAVMAVTPKMNLKPGIFAYPLKLSSDFEITLLANLITLTPGTLSVDVSEDRSVLYVHALDCNDIDATKRAIAQGFERKIMEAFRR
ncbi:Na+/H+ antiporter subunit E [Agrobacterium sp. rho-13.3]|uniref:Na+/H+ antiporter subunit E n=1 Tax=Agrobacterium sp. rho-13.3 TaxID=3072980 RepID=UPI002A0B2E19|nr:Na+/H+ antiporter subunit E [Agrobacterium sp. rho-13.3]MDX8308731.1 Na+/H+ antiporter subunit E [Agrobacterium sp. rho-13.3]